jgi:hypothetical protein
MGASAIAAYEFLKHLSATRADARASGQIPRRLMACRDDFRRIAAADTTAGLVQSALLGNEERQRLAIWLLGNSHDRCAIRVVHSFASGQPERVRREAVRTLCRLGASAELRWIAENDPDEVIRAMATQHFYRDFTSRLGQFVGEKRGHVEPPARDFCLLTTLNATGFGRPKSRDLIARLLRHIRFLLRGDA